MPFRFAYVCDLLEKLESLQVRDVPLLAQERRTLELSAVRIWFKSHHNLIHAPDTDRAALLSTLLPERRTDRVYWLREAGLIKVLGRCLGLGRDRLQILAAWTPDQHEDLATLCYRLQSATNASNTQQSISIEQLDRALHRLAARCRFSGPNVRSMTQGNVSLLPDDALRPILNRLCARELKWFIRLILKRYDPVELDDHMILRFVHPLLPRLLQFQSTFDAAVRILDSPLLANLRSAEDKNGFSDEVLREITAVYLKPQVGVKVGRPDYVKARSVKHCLNVTGKARWAIEPKYDGEYCQLHVDLTKGKNCIQIFSKSGKDSTQDRRDLHAWIKAALRIGDPACGFKTRCILEGEMVVYSDVDHSILDFDKIRKHVDRSGSKIGAENDSQKDPHEHLMMVFFDALLVDEEIVMSEPYEVRRRRLRQLINYYPGFCITADWGVLDFSSISSSRAAKKINKLFAKAIARRCEGLVLKPCDGPYFALTQNTTAGTVIKLKKDYIPGLGDTADFAIIGARRSALHISKSMAGDSKWTDFLIACIQNKEEVLRYHVKPIFRPLDVLSRPCIPMQDIDWMCANGKFYTEDPDSQGRQTAYSVLYERQDPRMAVMFKKPFIVEILGSSFDKPSSKSFYTLRHARVLKIHQDRALADVIGFDELQELASQAKQIPIDVQKEETEWYKRLQTRYSPKARKAISQSSDTTTTTVSPGAAKHSPRNPQPRRSTQSSPPLFVRVDTAELSMHIQGQLPDNPSRQRGNVGLLPTPPPSSPMFIMDASSQKQDPESLESSTVTHDPSFEPGIDLRRTSYITRTASQAGAATHPRKRVLAEISNTPEKPSMQDNEATKTTEAVIRIEVSSNDPLVEDDDDDDDHPSKRVRLSRAALQSARLLEVMEIVPASAPHSLDTAVQFETITSWSQVPGPEVVTPSSHSKSAVIDLRQHEDNQHRMRSAQSPGSGHPAEKPSRAVDRPITPIENPSFHPFAGYVFHLSPCVAKMPYLTIDLLPKLVGTLTGVNISSADSGHVVDSIEMWQRSLSRPERNGTPEIGESQAYTGMSKAVLVESRRRMQTRQLVQRVVADVELLRTEDTSGETTSETIRVWDWRVCEDLVFTFELWKRGVTGKGQSLDDLHDRARKILQKWYLGCVSWSSLLECNVFQEKRNDDMTFL